MKFLGSHHGCIMIACCSRKLALHEWTINRMRTYENSYCVPREVSKNVVQTKMISIRTEFVESQRLQRFLELKKVELLMAFDEKLDQPACEIVGVLQHLANP